MYKSAVMVSGRCLLKIHQNQNAFIDQWSKGRCLQDFCVHLGGQKVPPLPEPGCWCFFFSSMHGTQQNQVVCGIFMFFDEFPGSTTFFKEIPEIY